MSNVRSSRVNDWYNHFLTKRAVPLRRDLPTNTSTEGYAVVIRRLRLTKLVQNVTYHISCCFFDAKTSQFFGIPYRSAERRPTHNECELNDDLFFHCPHLDDAVSLVIEVVEKDTVTDNRPLSVAWGLLTVSGYEKTAPNYHSSSTSFDLQRIKLYPGSPKVLTFSPESHHTFAISGTLECSLYSHSRLLDAVDYFPEFCIIGNQYEIPGLLASESEPQLAAPIPMPHVPSSLDGISLSYGPHAERIEKLILDDINADRLYRENHAPSSKSEPMQVLERRLRVGVHNGFTFLFEPVVVHLSSIDEQFLGTHSLRRKSRRLTSCSDIRTEMNSLFVRPRVSLPKMIDDDRLVIVFALDYVFGIRANDKAILYSQNMIICWGAWQPFSNHSQLYENGHLQASVPLIGGPRPNPDESLCFKNLLHLFHRDDSIFIESAPKITIQFNFILDDTNPLNLSSRPQHQMSDSSPTTPAPQHEYVEEKAVKRNVERSSGRIQFQSNSFDTVHHSEQLPVVETKKPTKMASELHEKIDRVIEQESPRQNLPMIYALPLMETRPSNVTRSSHSVISNVPFPPIVDRDGNPPTIVDFNSTKFPYRIIEMNDNLSTNEFIIQFMALKRICSHRTNRIQKVFFTMQFYRFQQITTEELALSDITTTTTTTANGNTDIHTTTSSEPSILKRLNTNDEGIVESGAGFMVKFLVDRQCQSSQEQDDFTGYLYLNYLCIEVWDSESLIFIGSSYVPLQNLLRNGNEAVQCTIQCPVVFNAFIHEKLQVTALLYLRLANIGHPSSNQIDLLHSRNPCLVSQRLKRLGEEGPDSYRIRAKPLNPAHDSKLQKFLHAQRLDIQQRYEDVFNEQSYDRIRQWEKLKHTNILPSQQNMSVKKFLFEEELEAYRKLRNQSKASKLLESVFRGITSTHYIFPSLGEKIFFEYLLQNTFTEPINCLIEIDDPCLSIVMDFDEWTFYKRANFLETSSEKSLVLRNGTRLEIFLQPMEAVYVPFLFDDLKSTNSSDFQPYSTKVLFRRWDNLSAISILDLRVHRRPYKLNQTYRFFNEASSNCERIIKIRGIPKDLRIVNVRCLDPSVKVLLQHRGVEQELSVTAYSGEATTIKSLLVLLYGDRYSYKLLSTWKIFIHSLQRIDFHATMGQSVKMLLVLKRFVF